MITRIVLTVLLLSSVSGAFGQQVGQNAPGFTVDLLGGGTTSLSGYTGKVVYLFFFGWNCSHCVSPNGPLSQTQVAATHAGKPFQALGLDVWNGSSTGVQTFKSQTGIQYPLGLMASTIQTLYQVPQQDYSVVIDQTGIIRYRGAFVNPLEINAVVNQLLMTADVNAEAATPITFALQQNYPNPFNPTTTITYSLPHTARVTLTVHDILGQELAKVVDETVEPGVHTVSFDGARLASCVYFYRLQSDAFVQTKVMTLVR